MKAENIARAVLCALLIAAAPAAARVTAIDITTVEPFAAGASFGDSGAYERVKGTFRGELDPADPRNPCVNPRNPHNPNPALRALLVKLDEWVSEGKALPASRTPNIRDGTLMTPDKVRFPAIPGLQIVRRVNAIGVLKDWIKPEMDMSRPYRPLVPQVDANGNETSGIRLPDIAVPLATHTGWNLYKAPLPEGELCDRDGSFSPFPATRAASEASGDPRLSLEERYRNHAGYVQRVVEAANRLVAERLLLREDAEQIIARAKSAETANLFAQ